MGIRIVSRRGERGNGVGILVSEGKGNELVRVGSYGGRILLMWILIKHQLIATISVISV